MDKETNNHSLAEIDEKETVEEVSPEEVNPNDPHESALVLGRERVGKLLFKFALPAIAAMVASSIYNLVAGIFIANLGPYNISGVGLCAPFMNLAAAFGALVGVGASVLCSIFLGEKKYDKARHVLGNLILLNLLLGSLVTIFGLIYLEPILIFFGASENTLLPGKEYMTVILYGNVFAHMYLGLNSILRVSGYPISAMLITFVSVVINIALAPLFIFVFDMGVSGAAWATVVAQVVCCIIIFYLFTQKNRTVYLEIDKISFNREIIKRSLAIGSPNFCTNAAGCFIVVLQNYNLLKYGGDLYVGAFSIVNRIVFLFFMIVLGFSHGMQPIVAYNFGAKKYTRMWEAFRLTLICALCVTTLGTLVCEIFPEALTSMFVSGEGELDVQLTEITVDAFRKIAIAFWIISCQVIGANFFASMNQPKKSLFLSLTRQVIFMFPLLVILPKYIGVDGVWYTMPITDVIAAICAIVMLTMEYRKQHGLKAAV